ncbi:DUF5348 domain-containing protein [Alicyclobacillus cycloheptanicus]|uniref:DUF5348 domain-containing protein n=1 Tax=Alicyclobacillus cycloheptanicus TaxID=1457 RepID=UPI00237846B8|nr:DUF5348 domain-containing protein [Alicyclobacillus cycloheptanicus]WDM02537.1 DUF5348 domain-containing protein [Alicyclobacillus cycloheptanicus]
MTGNLRFSSLRDRWYFADEQDEHDLHCGDPIEIEIGDRYYYARIEWCAEGWYAIFHEDNQRSDAFVLMRNRTYTARWIYF